MAFWWYFVVFVPQSTVKFSSTIFFLGLCPAAGDLYDEGLADMICDGVNDLFNVLVKIFLEKDETKKVYLIALFEGLEPMLCILTLRMFTIWGWSRGVKKKWDIVTRWLGLGMWDIPFPRTSVLKIVCGRLSLELPAGDHLRQPISRTPFSRILYSPEAVPWISCLSVLQMQEEIRKEFETTLPT